MGYTSDELVTDVRELGAFPDSSHTAARILRQADMAMQTDVSPTVLSARSDYWITTTEIPLVDGTVEYRLPRRAVASTARDVYLRDSQGRSHNLPHLGPFWGRQFEGNTWGVLPGYFLRGEKLVLSGALQSSQALSIVISYERRPSRLVSTSLCEQITSFDDSNLQKPTAQRRLVFGGSLPTTSSWENAPLDLVQNDPQLDVVGVSLVPVSTGASLMAGFIEFDDPLEGLNVGDWMCLAGESCVVQVPPEAYPMLVQATVLRLLEADGDQEAAMLARQQLEIQRVRLETLLTPRHRNGSRRLVARSSPLRSKRWGWFF